MIEQAFSRLILVRTNVTAFATRSNVSVWRMHRSDELGSATTLWASSFVIRNDVLYKESHGLPLSEMTSAWCRLQRPSEGSQMISTVLILLAKSPPRQLPLTMQALAMVASGAVTVLSHPSLAGIASGSGISGSTAWHGAFRFRQYLKGLKPADGEQPDTDLRQLEFKKNQ